jgi:hypothetical protein
METYITHIKITEYQTSPTAPPPPSARTPQFEKPRVIIVAVRKSGRVRLHKSKENPNGTFSIGKTWFLDDLTAIESFTGPTVAPNNQQWAGDVGFVVTLGKPYYWEAQTDKEKKFFIASLIKIYNKYTGGRTPTLAGFEQRELEQVLGGAQVPRRQDRPPPRPAPLDTAAGNGSISSGYNAPPSAQSTATSVFPERVASRSPLVANGKSSPAQSIDTGRPSQEQQSLRRLASSNKSQDSVAASSITRSEDANSLRPSTRNGVNGPSPYGTPEPTPLPATDDTPPERKRPPMDPLRPMQVDRNLIPAPLMSPGMRREPTVPPRSVERITPRKDSISRRNEPPPRAEQVATPNETSKPDLTGRMPSPAVSTPPPSAPPTAAIPPIPTPTVDKTPVEPPPEPEEETKPGLGPMIKSKKSKGEIAGAFWKAANAASAFKPRPGGAAERLRQNQNKVSDGPDGITSVVPAPPKPAPVQKPPEPVVEPPPKAADRSAAPNIPEVKVTESDPARPSSAQPSVKESKEKKAEEPPTVEETRRSIVAGNDTKYLATLGIDPSVLDSRTNEFAKWLDYFGWVPGEKMRARNFDELRADLDRELSKAQAGGWLARFQEEDERVEAIKRGIDLSISECDELDNLLTLYSVELSVSLLSSRMYYMVLTSDRRSPMILRTLRRRAKVYRCRPPTRSCSGRNLSPCWRHVPLVNPILTP